MLDPMRELVGMTAVVMAVACGPLVELPEGSSGGASSGAEEEGSGRVTTGPMGTTGRPATTREADTGAVDDGPRLDLPNDSEVDPDCVDWPFGGCTVPSPRGAVEGTTPLGEFATTLSVFGSDAGCGGVCWLGPNIIRLHLVADPALISELEPWSFVDESLVIELDQWGSGGFEGPVGRVIVATLYANRDGVTVQTSTAEVVIDTLPSAEELSEPYDPRAAVVVTGTVTAQGDGWNVMGTFAASYCPDVNEYAICE